MVDGGEYSKKGRIVGNHVGIDPIYINAYMDMLDTFYIYHKSNSCCESLATLVYFNFITIHSFSDGNGRVGKALFYILKKDEKYRGVTTENQHIKLCEELEKMQIEFDCLFNHNIDVKILREI